MIQRFHLAVSAAALLLFCTSPAMAAEAPLERVVLSTSGLANFVHRAEVSGDATVDLPVRLDQVDDLLKSLVVFDKDGRIGGVTLPGRQPLDQVFRDLPFSRADLADPAALLNAYQGAAVTIKGNSAAMSGRLVQVTPEETVTESDKTIIRHRVTLMTADGIRQALLEDVQSVQFDDARVRGEIARALDAIRDNGTSDRRVLAISLPGKDKRTVTLSYVVEAPLWKTAYRMVMPHGNGGKGLLQGWAVVENMTASDWNNVDMTLVSGNPVTFRQSLYQSYYVPRPDIPVQVFGRVMPRTDTGSLRPQAAMADDSHGRSRMMMKSAAPAAAPMMQESLSFADAAVSGMGAGMPEGYGLGNIVQAANAAVSEEGATQVLFRFPEKVTLRAGQSLMLPFASRDAAMTRLSVYQQDSHARHPFAAVELHNDGAAALPSGVLTLYEEEGESKKTSYVGDAVMPAVPAGEKRLVSYALDMKTTVDRADKSASKEGKITISQGVMRVAVRTVLETAYTLKAPEKEPRTLVIEHPRQHDYVLAAPDAKDAETTQTHYRLRVPLKAGETKTLDVRLERDGMQSYAIVNLSTDQLIAYAGKRGELDGATRKAFAKMAEIRRAIDSLRRDAQEKERQQAAIFADQERVRENLKSLSGTSDIQQKYLQKLNAQEENLGQLEAARNKLAADIRKKEEELQKLIADLEV